MRNLFSYCLSLLFVACFFLACDDNDDKGSKIERISIFQADYDYDGKEMVLRIKDNQSLQLIPLIFPSTVENKTLTYKNDNPSLMEVSTDGFIIAKAIGIDRLTVKATDGSGTSQSYKVFITDHMVKATKITVKEDFKEITLGMTGTFNFATAIEFAPADTWDKSLTYVSSNEEIATVDEDGIITGVFPGEATITATTKDGTNLSDFCTVTVGGVIEYDRTGWKVTTSHNIPADPAISNAPESLIDGNTVTCLSMVKPGKNYGEIPKIPETDEVSFVIDMGKEQEINYFRLRHRNSTLLLRVYEVGLYGSNDNKTFTPIETGIDIPDAGTGSVMDSGNVSFPVSTYRYLKVALTRWDTSGGSTMQIAEFYLGLDK